MCESHCSELRGILGLWDVVRRAVPSRTRLRHLASSVESCERCLVVEGFAKAVFPFQELTPRISRRRGASSRAATRESPALSRSRGLGSARSVDRGPVCTGL